MAKLGWRIILLIDQKKVAEPYATDEGIAVKNWPSPRATTWQDALFLAKLIRLNKPLGVIGTFGSVNISLLVSFLFGVPNRLAWYCTNVKAQKYNYPGSDLKFKFLFFRKKLIYGLSSGIISISQGGITDFADNYWSNKACLKCYRLIPDPLKNLATSTTLKPKPVITFIGSFKKSKDPFTPIKILKRLSNDWPELRLYMIGEGPLKVALHKMVLDFNLEDKVCFKGWLSHHEIYQNLSLSTANLCTSYSEAFGKVNTQALGMGVPLIATRVEGIKDILKEGYNGYGIEPGDDETAAAHIHSLLGDPAHQQTLAKQARKDFEERFMLEYNVADQAQKLAAFLSNKS